MLAEAKFSCGRSYLKVAGVIVAMQGDPFRGELPETVLRSIPKDEMATAKIGDTPAKELPIGLVRHFRGDRWTPEMLEYVAGVINEAAEPKGETDE